MSYLDPEKQAEYQRNWFQKNKRSHQEGMVRRRRERGEWFYKLKLTLKCELCPENHPACLEFHHKDPSTKRKGVSDMVVWGLREEVILAEIAKCHVWCSNCHQKHHWQERQDRGMARYTATETPVQSAA